MVQVNTNKRLYFLLEYLRAAASLSAEIAEARDKEISGMDVMEQAFHEAAQLPGPKKEIDGALNQLETNLQRAGLLPRDVSSQ